MLAIVLRDKCRGGLYARHRVCHGAADSRRLYHFKVVFLISRCDGAADIAAEVFSHLFQCAALIYSFKYDFEVCIGGKIEVKHLPGLCKHLFSEGFELAVCGLAISGYDHLQSVHVHVPHEVCDTRQVGRSR